MLVQEGTESTQTRNNEEESIFLISSLFPEVHSFRQVLCRVLVLDQSFLTVFFFGCLRAGSLLQEAEGRVGWEGETADAGVHVYRNAQNHGELVQRRPADLRFVQIQHHHHGELLHPRVSQHRRQGGRRALLLRGVQRRREGRVWGDRVHPRSVPPIFWHVSDKLTDTF